MKTPFLFFALIVSVSISSLAQSGSGPNIWLGNTYGPATDWHHPANWSKGHVPTETETVLIPDLSNKGIAHYPIIRYEAEIGHLYMHQLAELTIESMASLRILYPESNIGIPTANIDNQGSIFIGPEEALPDRPRYSERLQGTQ